MEKPYLNQKELTELLGQGRRYGERVMKHLLDIAKERNYYIPASERDILIPTHFVTKEINIKEIVLSINGKESKNEKDKKKIKN